MERRIKVIVTKIGLDGHTTGARLVAQVLREAGMEVVYLGPFQTPETIVETVVQEDADVIGISCLGQSYMLILDVIRLLKERNLDGIVVVAGGTITPVQAAKLKAAGVSEVFPPGSSPESIVNSIVSSVRKTRG